MSYPVFTVLGVADRERLSVVQSYRFALDLTPRQERVVLAHAGAARVAHNWALARVKAVMDQRAAERTYGIGEADLTPPAGWSLPALRRGWNAAKDEVASWAYKTTWNGGRLVVADRWYPSSKTCSGCGTVKAKLALSERTYTCTTCGLVLDRDVNAARNLAALAAEASTAGSGPVAGRGADRETPLAGLVAVKRQPGTATAGKTGTVPPQGRTSNHVPTNAP